MRRLLFCLSLYVLCFASFAQSPPKIGFLMDDHLIPRWAKDSTEFCRAVRELGGKPIVANGNNDPEQQIIQAAALIEQGAQVLVVIPTDGVQAAKIVDLAHNKGVKVVAYDRLILHPELDYYASFDNVEVGRLQAQYILSHLDRGNVMLLNGPKADFNSSLFREGQLSVLQPLIDSGKIHVVLDKSLSEWTSLAAFMELNEFFGEGQVQLDAVLATNDAIAEGVQDALETYYDGGNVLITGQDGEQKALERIRAGTQSMTVMKPIDQLAEQTAQLALWMVEKGQKPSHLSQLQVVGFQVPSLQIAPFIVHKSNVNQAVRE